MLFEGTLIKELYAKGSKSEREAVFLELEGGDKMLLFRIGGNPFYDEELLNLIGKEVMIEGILEDNNVYFTAIYPLPSGKQ
jgi:hypothetical protein